MNFFLALRVCETFVSSSQIDTTTKGEDQSYYKRPFIFISAEDIFRPIIPARYIETKREAERGIHELVQENANIRAAFIRPSKLLTRLRISAALLTI